MLFPAMVHSKTRGQFWPIVSAFQLVPRDTTLRLSSQLSVLIKVFDTYVWNCTELGNLSDFSGDQSEFLEVHLSKNRRFTFHTSVNPFTLKSDQFETPPAASPEISHHTV